MKLAPPEREKLSFSETQKEPKSQAERDRGRRPTRRPTGSAIGLRQRQGFTNTGQEKGDGKNFVQALPKGYILSSYKVPLEAYRFIEEVLAGYALSPGDVKLFKHILISGGFRTNARAGYVPVGWDLINRKLTQTSAKRLYDAGLVERTGFSVPKRQSREYRVVEWIRKGFFRILKEGIQDAKVDLFSGKPTDKKAKSIYYDQSRNPYPKLITIAMRLIEHEGLCNFDKANEYLDRMGWVADAWERARDICVKGSAEWIRANQKTDYYQCLLNHDIQCLNAVWDNRIEEPINGIVRYRIAYEPISTGRLKHPPGQPGGPLNFSRGLKDYAYSGIGVYNYDLESSQAYGLQVLLEQAGIVSPWLQDFLTHPEGKKPYYTAAGISKDAFKSCLYAVFYGSPLYQPSGKPFQGEVWNIIEAEAERLGKDSATLYRQLFAVLEPLDRECRRPLYGWLRDTFIPDKKEYAKGRAFIRNALDLPFWLDEHSEREIPKTLSAHLLQGLEAYFIHTLTAIVSEYGVKAISNEHDGLITLSPIPKAAIEATQHRTKLVLFNLVEKPFEVTPLDQLGEVPESIGSKN